MTRGEAIGLVGMLRAAWPRQAVEQPTLDVYALALEDLDLGPTRAAVARLVQTSRFFPTAAEIRERAVRDRVALPSPEEAWGLVRRAIGRHGSYRVPAFDCDEIQAAVDVIGWKELCRGDNPAANRARFIDSFRAFAAQRMDAEATGRYRPADRQLPPRGDERELGDVRVLVETGYATPRLALVPLPGPQKAARQLADGLADKLTRRP